MSIVRRITTSIVKAMAFTTAASGEGTAGEDGVEWSDATPMLFSDGQLVEFS